tara:strand:- start:1448 stop:3229 length:1782 start_codon:yes stop_codon:yes gene_type:complete
LKYRAEIDGLRAIAVVPVILFHVGFEIFSGGYVGVDIFFVISGYLITMILIEDIENKRFDLVYFYERRARRILPALFFVMLICIPFAWLWMLPDPLENFGQSLLSTSLFSNNFLLMITSTDYWALTGEYKPMLHTWSLAVEEQYYLLFPVFLIFTWRFGRSRVFWMIIIMALISFSYSEWGWRNHPLLNFYFTFSRIWELLAGSIAAFIVFKYGVIKNNYLSILGLIAILFSIFLYDETVPFPSFFTLLPVLGSVMLVLYAEKDTFTAKILSNKGLVAVGLISYSLYLWHQPILAFTRIYQKEPLSDLGALFIVFLTTLFAFFTWKFIETPFRNRTKVSSKIILRLSIFMMIGFIAMGLYLDKTNGAPQRLFIDEEYQRSTHEIKVASVSRVSLEDVELNNLNNNRIFILGDSFAGDIAYLFEYKYPRLIDYELINSGSPSDTVCQTDLWTKAAALNISLVLFAYDEGFNISCIEDVIETANKKNIEVLFVGGKQFGYNLNWIARLESDDRKSLCQAPIPEAIKIDLRDIKNIPKKNYFSFFDSFLDNNCFPITNSSGELLSSDRRHFTVSGVEFFADKFFQNQTISQILDTR